MACANYRVDKSTLGVILPVMGFIIIGGQHCVADAMYYLFTPGFAWVHVGYLMLTFVGNLIGAILVVFAS
jgi:formate/nitrite transporter FocA (FNT family)